MLIILRFIASTIFTVLKFGAAILLLSFLALRSSSNSASYLATMNEEDDILVEEGEPYDYPSVDDVLTVKEILMQVAKMPVEIADLVIDHAEYWPHSTIGVQNNNVRSLVAHGQSNARRENIFVVRSLPIGILPAQLDPDTRSAVIDEFVERKPKPVTACSNTVETKSHRWASENSPRGRNPCRKIVFTITSHDQGWGGNVADRGTFNGSFTWFDAGLERIESHDASSKESVAPGLVHSTEPEESSENHIQTLRTLIPALQKDDAEVFDHPFLPRDTHIVRNRTATKATQHHVITWSYKDDVPVGSPAALELKNIGRGEASGNGEFVRNLQVGDIVTVWARARFMGWRNFVDECKIDVYWAV